MKIYPVPEGVMNNILGILTALPWRQANGVIVQLQEVINRVDGPPQMNGESAQEEAHRAIKRAREQRAGDKPQ